MIVPGVPCLVYNPDHAWVPGVVDDFDGTVGAVTCNHPKNAKLTKVAEKDIFVCDERAMEEDVDDLLNLTVLHDGTLLNCLRHRYMKDIVYTNIGAIVVALNPFNFKIPWYMDGKMQAYLSEGDTIQNNLPHSWAVAHNTYYEMRNDSGNQCILVSGESGAGKTEASKIVMKYLGAVSSLRGKEEEKLAGQQVGIKMMQSNPILEAFGNAKTVRNDNSSRFGKLMKIKFNNKGILTGADITKYLLEKSRIITAAPDERVYHSFYLVLKGQDREKYDLNPIGFYKTVNSGKCTDVPGIDDTDDYNIVMDAMTTCGVADAQRESIWRTLAGILNLMNLEFEEVTADDCKFEPSTEEMLTKTAKSWAVSEEKLRHELLTTTITIQKQDVVKTLNKTKAIDARDSLCKATYDHVFAWLVTTINRTIDTTDVDSWIALLDIFGFEDFKVNSFEQLCINLTNETLQGHYNSYIFIRDMDECRAEGIDTTEIKFPDNKPCLEMISGKGGILAVLDEECLLGKATDLTFLDKICDKFLSKDDKMSRKGAQEDETGMPTIFFERPRLAKVPSFKINHYAGSVTYDVANFLEKNRDTLKDAFKRLMRESTDPFVAELLPEPAEGLRYTVGGYFKNQLRELMDLINSTNPHWIRCIKPHPARKPLHFDGPSTLNQLRSSGVLGTVQIRKAGYPIRIKLPDFVRRYKIIARGIDGVDFSNLTQVTQAVFKSAGFTTRLAQVGKQRAFMKSEAYQQLELLKKSKLQVYATTAVNGALVALARQRTAAFLRYAQISRVQALLRVRGSQLTFRKREYEVKKDVIIAQVKFLLKLQQEEERRRAEMIELQGASLQQLAAEEQSALQRLEAQWWAEKPARDQAQLGLLEAEEERARQQLEAALTEASNAISQDMREDYLDAVEAQAEREEEERQQELQQLREEEERLKREEEERQIAEREAAARRKEEQRRVAIYYWNKKKKEEVEAQQRKEAEERSKQAWMREAQAAAVMSHELLRHEKTLLRRERAEYPPSRFVTSAQKPALSPVKDDILLGVRRGHGGLGDSSLLREEGSALRERRAYFRRGGGSASASPAIGSPDMLSEDGEGAATPPPLAIGGLNPMLVNPAEEKLRLNRERLVPDRSSSLQLVAKLRKLQTVRDALVLRTPTLKADDVRNPMNPTSPDWNPPNPDCVILPDGTQLKMSEVEVPPEEAGGRRRRRRHGKLPNSPSAGDLH